jgi:hypothetical protein
MTDDKILDRVRKLLELANNNLNVNEAANAAAAAQELMTRHAIGEAMLAPVADTVDEQIEADLLYAQGKKHATWRGILAVVMAEVNQCKVFVQGGDLRIIGRPSDAATVRYLFSYVIREIERLCKEEAGWRGNPGRVWCNNFKLGAVESVNKRLRESAAQARAAMRREASANDTMGTGSAIVLVNNALAKLDKRTEDVRAFAQAKFKLRSRGTAHFRNDDSGREAGRRAGAHIELNPARGGALGAGARRSLQS